MPAPNVVFVIADQHRWDFMGYESNGVTLTPNLDRIAAGGTILRSAYCTSPLCSPSREAVASGRYGMNTGCFTNLHELPAGTPTFVSQLRAAGYATCAIGKTHMEIHAYDSDLTGPRHCELMDSLGWDAICEVSGNGMLKTGIRCAYSRFLRDRGAFDSALRFYRRWRYFMDPRPAGDPEFRPHAWPLAEELQETAFIGNTAVRWLRQRDRRRPFFLHVGFAAPHSPIEPNDRHLARYGHEEEPPPVAAADPPEWLGEARRGYRAMITHVDHYVGEIRRALDEQGELDNTVFLYTADHGEMAGDHGRFGKTSFHEASVRVPLLLAGPGIVRGQDSRALVELIDLGRTVCDLCGVPAHELDQGRGLAGLLAGRTDTHRETVYAEMGCDRMLFDGRYKLMWGDPHADTRRLGRLHLDKPVDIAPSPARLYDLAEDPHETRDLAADPSRRELLATMLQKLLARLNENLQPQPLKSRGEYRPL